MSDVINCSMLARRLSICVPVPCALLTDRVLIHRARGPPAPANAINTPPKTSNGVMSNHTSFRSSRRLGLGLGTSIQPPFEVLGFKVSR